MEDQNVNIKVSNFHSFQKTIFYGLINSLFVVSTYDTFVIYATISLLCKFVDHDAHEINENWDTANILDFIVYEKSD